MFEERNASMVKLRWEDCETLQVIADKYSLTRERVRQIVGNMPDDFKKTWTENKIEETDLSKLSLSNLQSLPGRAIDWRRAFRETHHMITGESNAASGNRAEIFASKVLAENGVENKLMPCRHAFDMMTSLGKKIDVKSASKKMLPASQKHYPYYSINISKDKRGEYADFFVIVIKMKTVFVIPSKDLPKHCGAIRIFYPQKGKKPSKWTQYIDRFDLLA